MGDYGGHHCAHRARPQSSTCVAEVATIDEGLAALFLLLHFPCIPSLGTVALVGVAMAIMLTTVSSSPFLGFHKPLPSSDTVPDIPLRPYCEPLFNIRRPKLRAKLRSVYLSLKLKLGFSGMSASYDAAYKLLLKAFRNGYKGVGGEHLADAPSKEQGHPMATTPNQYLPLNPGHQSFTPGAPSTNTKYNPVAQTNHPLGLSPLVEGYIAPPPTPIHRDAYPPQSMGMPVSQTNQYNQPGPNTSQQLAPVLGNSYGYPPPDPATLVTA
ncbi:hypothetical protein BJ085DRAFT_28921 [Dimargaris cristalligena]|uniref:Uncharacterized protein n=1 Tax=Dimargaris cristalligena TaxID=215637 RepID=A0A4P9ZWM0_9FUNG|nr:hypothetical protein BJ085DRAFT_28921 [Dimargaris cristalligena]|eukprot:RKP38066.1 hypothetical protein BJ085DRAFT_28921 [Dimargaris cristalligena]